MEILLIASIILTSFAVGHIVGYHRGYARWVSRMDKLETKQRHNLKMLAAIEAKVFDDN